MLGIPFLGETANRPDVTSMVDMAVSQALVDARLARVFTLLGRLGVLGVWGKQVDPRCSWFY